jgi:hypothetical protein
MFPGLFLTMFFWSTRMKFASTTRRPTVETLESRLQPGSMLTSGLGQLGGVLDLEGMLNNANSRSEELAVKAIQRIESAPKADQVVIDHGPQDPGLKKDNGQIGTTDQLPSQAKDVFQGGRERFIDLGNHVLDGGSGNFWYGGDFNGVNGLANEQSSIVSSAQTYDDFIVPAGHKLYVGGIWTSNLQNYYATTANWSIRTGISSGSGGTVVKSGTAGDGSGCSNYSLYFTGNTGFGFLELTSAIDLQSCGFTLQPGKYWLQATPISTQPGTGRSFNSTTSGTNGVSHSGTDIGNGRSFFNSTFFGYNFQPTESVLGAPTDFSMGTFGAWLG